MRFVGQLAGYDLAADEHIFVNASLASAKQLFPTDLLDAIRRDPDPSREIDFVAAISMVLPKTTFEARLECQMTLTVTDDKVQHLARELFGIRLETTAGLRYVCASGTKILPNPKATFRGCQSGIIRSTFGDEVCSAIRTSPTYQDDARRWRDTTDAVSMIVSHAGDDGADICLRLGLIHGTQIKQKLYDSQDTSNAT